MNRSSLRIRSWLLWQRNLRSSRKHLRSSKRSLQNRRKSWIPRRKNLQNSRILWKNSSLRWMKKQNSWIRSRKRSIKLLVWRLRSWRLYRRNLQKRIWMWILILRQVHWHWMPVLCLIMIRRNWQIPVNGRCLWCFLHTVKCCWMILIKSIWVRLLLMDIRILTEITVIIWNCLRKGLWQ